MIHSSSRKNYQMENSIIESRDSARFAIQFSKSESATPWVLPPNLLAGMADYAWFKFCVKAFFKLFFIRRFFKELERC